MTNPDTPGSKALSDEAIKEIADEWRAEREAYERNLVRDPQGDLIRQEAEDQKFYKLINTYARRAEERKGARKRVKVSSHG